MAHPLRNSALLAVVLLLAQTLACLAHAPGQPSEERRLVQARYDASVRIVSRLFADFVCSTVFVFVETKHGGEQVATRRRLFQSSRLKPQVERLGPAMRCMFESELPLGNSPHDRLSAALRYYRLATWFWITEKHRFETGQEPAVEFDSKARFFAHDAAVEVVRARRACGLTEPILNDRGFVRGAFQIKATLLDMLTIAAGSRLSGQAPEAGNVARLSKEVDEAMKLYTPPSRDPELEHLLTLRCEFATQKLQSYCQVFQAGARGGALTTLFDSLTHRLKAELDLSSRLSDQVKAYERACTIAKWIEPICETRFKLGEISQVDRDLARYHRLDLEIQLLRAKNRLAAETKSPKK
jgi:hypothetical protein